MKRSLDKLCHLQTVHLAFGFRKIDPATFPVAAEDGFADQDLAMTVCKGGEGGPVREVARRNVSIEGTEQLLERIGEAFIVTSGMARNTGGRLAHQRGVAHQCFIRPVTMTNPKGIRTFTVPG